MRPSKTPEQRSDPESVSVGLRRDRHSQRGNIPILFAFVSTILLAMTGGAIDYARVVSTKATMQEALDAAVLVGASVDPSGAEGAATAFFSEALVKSGPIVSPANITPTLTAQPDGSFTGAASTTIHTDFLRFVGLRDMSVAADSRAIRGELIEQPGAQDGCVFFTDPRNQGLEVKGGGEFSADCTIHLRSKKAILVRNNGSLEAGGICTKGSIKNQGGTLTPGSSTPGCTVNWDPFDGMKEPAEAKGGCTHGGPITVNNGQSQTFNPGVYCGLVRIKKNATVSLSPGIYAFRGGLTIDKDGELKGEDVLLVLSKSINTYTFNGKLDIEGLRTGDYAGFVIFHEDFNGNSNKFAISSHASFKADGVIYLPNTRIDLAAHANELATRSILVTDRISIGNNSSFTAKILEESDTPLAPGLGVETTTGSAWLSY
ncbi:MAG: TadE/TadG family type IV pilus assembly protein [Pseudomonadota bacterium]